MVKNNSMSLNKMHEVGDEVLGMVEGLPNLGPFTLRYEVGMGLACYNLMLSTRKGKNPRHFQWDSKRKYTTELSNIYKVGECGSWSTIFAKYERKLMATDFSIRGLWFVEFMRGGRLRMGIIRKHDFEILVLTMAALQITWHLEW